MGPAFASLDRVLGAVVAGGSVLALPLSLLLFAQWPLRDAVHAYSREANDVAQILFAFYVSIAITAATRQRAHLAADALARSYPARLRRAIDVLASALATVPWAAFIAYAAWHETTRSVLALERFPDTFNPGYFLLRIALVLLALLALIQAIVDVCVGKRAA